MKRFLDNKERDVNLYKTFPKLYKCTLFVIIRVRVHSVIIRCGKAIGGVETFGRSEVGWWKAVFFFLSILIENII